MLKRSALFAFICAISSLAYGQGVKPVEVAAGDLTAALESLARQIGVELVYQSDQLNGLKTEGVVGMLSAEEAVTKLLEGTALTLRTDSSGAMLIARPREGESEATSLVNASQFMDGRRASAENQTSSLTNQSEGSEQKTTEDSSKNPRNKEVMEEIVVTGTHIRGAHSASPLTVIDRREIEATGYSTIYQITESLPLMFGGGAQRDTSFGDLSSDSRNNISRGATLNMRGLGAHATLVLLDGHRLPGSGPGHFVDISMIPVSAIERIEILADGASATYGSDAVAGVVNIVTKDSLRGVDVGARYGSSTQSGYQEVTADATFGFDWSRGNAIATYSFQDESNLATGDRDFSRPVVGPHDLFGAAETNSLFLSGNVDIANGMELYFRGYATARENDRMFTQSARTNRDVARSEQYYASAGLRRDIGSSWRGDLFAGFAEHQLHNRNSRITLPQVLNINSYDQASMDVEALAEGPLWSLSAGDIRLALGANYRKEDFEQLLSSDPIGTAFSGDRSISSAFAELMLPLVSPDSPLGLIEASLAIRYESHSDFGSTTDPKYGLLWEPGGGLRLRATYGTSFRAPTFTEIVAQYELSQLTLVPDPTSPTESSLTLYRPYGANRDLAPETAESWTVGFDLDTPLLPGSAVSATFFRIAYSDRISQPFAVVTNVLRQEALYAPVIDRTPDPALIADLISRPFTGATGFLNSFGPFDPASIAVIIDNRYRNVAESTVKGIDAALRYGRSLSIGDVQLSLNATYLVELEQVLLPGAAGVDMLNSVGQPVDFRARADLGFTRGALTFGAAVNFTDSYTNRDSTPRASVDSWTTLDLRVALEPNSLGWLKDTRFAVNAVNLLDEPPPFVGVSSNLQLPVGYDPTNASPLGCLLSLEVRKRF
jgi:outer membrane receptor protein involved in Fe transport